MNLKKTLLILTYLAFTTALLLAQESKEKNWTLNGYTKSMQGLFLINAPPFGQQSISDNFLHNRLNFTWYPSDNWTYKMGLRTRFFFGERSRLLPNFKEDLSLSLIHI